MRGVELDREVKQNVLGHYKPDIAETGTGEQEKQRQSKVQMTQNSGGSDWMIAVRHLDDQLYGNHMPASAYATAAVQQVQQGLPKDALSGVPIPQAEDAVVEAFKLLKDVSRASYAPNPQQNANAGLILEKALAMGTSPVPQFAWDEYVSRAKGLDDNANGGK